MNKRRDYYLTSLLVILTLLVTLFTVHTTSLLTTGIGFGKDARFIVSTQNENRLDEFIALEMQESKEIRKINIADDMYLLTMSGVEQIDDYKEKLEKSDFELEVVVKGSFGSLTKLKNNESFIAAYFIVFFIILSLYFLNRFKLIGFLSALETIFIVVGSLFFAYKLNFVFTKTLWYAVLISVIMLIYHEQRYLRLFEGQSLEEVVKSGKEINKTYLQTQIIQAIFFFFIGYIAISATSFAFFSVGRYMFALGTLSLIKIGARRFVLFPLFIYSAQTDDHPQVLKFYDQAIFNWKSDTQKKFNILSLILGVFLVFVLALGLFRGFELKESEDYTNQNVMIINRADANSYLQLQALLHEEGMIDKQRGYDVSEQEDLWIKFSDKVTFTELEEISKFVGKEMNVSVTYYNTGSVLNPLETPVFYSILAFFVLLGWLMVWTLYSFSASTLFPFAAISASAIFVLFLSAFHVEWTREIVYVAWSLPVVLATIVSGEGDLFKRDSFKEAFLKTSSLNFIILLMMAIPVFAIVPTSIAVEMVWIIILMLTAIHLALFLLNVINKLLERLMIRGG